MGKMVMAVIFKSRPGKTAMLMGLRKKDAEGLKEKLPLGGKVSETLFPV